eukprot:5740219-Prymnesium_polylepis.1
MRRAVPRSTPWPRRPRRCYRRVATGRQTPTRPAGRRPREGAPRAFCATVRAFPFGSRRPPTRLT